MTEKQFRETESCRNELRECLSNRSFRDALTIIITKRRVVERAHESEHLDADERASLRLFSQRIGMEDLILQLHELTTPETIPAGDPESTFGQDEAFRKLQELQDANNQ